MIMMTLAGSAELAGRSREEYITRHPVENGFALARDGDPAPLWVSDQDFPGVLRVAGHLQADMEKVTGNRPLLINDSDPAPCDRMIIAGTLGKNPLIDQLVQSRRISGKWLKGKRETYIATIIKEPAIGIREALVIAGSDKLGTIYGLYDLSRQIGVSPLHFWADVPVSPAKDLYAMPGEYTPGEPAVRYRGIFINDEAPALSGWVHERYGAFNSRFYEHVFEYILRMRGNFLWPAMWGRAFYDDDPENPRLADEYGIVIGTSHHEPMMRAHVEWARYGSGEWNYQTNPMVLRDFWREGMKRKGNYESIVTVGMRGDGDEPMGTERNRNLLEQIIDDQRRIIEEVTGKSARQTPQMWALYKEVQDYHDQGMDVPDDVTLLFCDDNWGNVRKLPRPGQKPRAGGYGMYYHFDYVGGPRNYKWLNTNQISRVWEQMDLCYRHGVDRIWVVNVGDIKPMEFPTAFFLEMAWDPGAMTRERMSAYPRKWAAAHFGEEYAGDIAGLLTAYTQFNSRRKPELINPGTYHLFHYREAEKVVASYRQLEKRALELYRDLEASYRDAFFQLVLFPIQACANLNEMYVTAAKNHLYAREGRAATNATASRVEELFARDSLLISCFHNDLAGGKWNHMMSQTHIGYTYWQEPPVNVMPAVERITVPESGPLKISPDSMSSPLPVLDPFGSDTLFFEVYNTGATPRRYVLKTGHPWLKVSSSLGSVDQQCTFFLTADWDKVPAGRTETYAELIQEPGRLDESVRPERIPVTVYNPVVPGTPATGAFFESNGCVAIEAMHYSRRVQEPPLVWEHIPDFGRTHSGMRISTQPGCLVVPQGKIAELSFDIVFFSQGTVQVEALFSPTLDFHGKGLRYAISFDDEPFRTVDVHGDYNERVWETWVADNIIRSRTGHQIRTPGLHTLRIRAVDPFLVLQRIEIDTGGLRPSYLGPPESYHNVRDMKAEDGYRLWLRYRPLDADLQDVYAPFLNGIHVPQQTATMKAAIGELKRAAEDLTGLSPGMCSLSEVEHYGGIIAGTWEERAVRKEFTKNERAQASNQGFLIKSNGNRICIGGKTDKGVLYGVFHLLRLIQTGQCINNLNVVENPAYDLRILNHWDNPDRSVERGYAGLSLWEWEQLPDSVSTRYHDYARACASLGINATVLNNVNADACFLTPGYLRKIAVLADVFRPYNLKVFLSVNFSSPEILGGLPTSDPLDPEVNRWWKEKVREIYKYIPDFGGFLVKANSEGRSGPLDFDRTHADGANMLARAVEPYGGLVMWRAFVYSPGSDDRAKQAYEEFMPLDGTFLPNVLIQVKNGPVDFQPREPFNPLFGAMRKTPLMIEFQITQEYLGWSKQVAYLAPLYKEVLSADTYALGLGTTVAKATDGSLFAHPVSAIAGVANTGTDRNWTGHHLAQANWYAFGRLAWDHELTSEEILREWVAMTFTADKRFMEPLESIMMGSREAIVNYMMPLGLHHLFYTGHHYGPEPWANDPFSRPDWQPPYYHKADAQGLGFDRSRTGSNAASQYFEPLAGQYDNMLTCPENLLLWFHHVPWDHRLKNGNTLWEELCRLYTMGVDQARGFQRTWDSLEPYVDPGRFLDIQRRLKIQARDAQWWRDACLLYFQTFSRQPIPLELERPIHDLGELMSR
jgi:alpha-glucuronidase